MMNESTLVFSVATLASLCSTVTSPDYSAHHITPWIIILLKSTAIKAPPLVPAYTMSLMASIDVM